MLTAGRPGGRIMVHDGPQRLVVALRVRAAARIPVPEGGLVPGTLDRSAFTTPGLEVRVDLVEAWRSWWEALVRTVPLRPMPPEPGRYELPDFSGLDELSPALRGLALRYGQSAARWSLERKRGRGGPAPATAGPGLDARRRGAALDLVLLPVDGLLHNLGSGIWLVPERLVGGDGWSAALDEIANG